METRSHIYYLKHIICEHIFPSRYFARHECNFGDTSESNNEMEINDEDLLDNDAFDSAEDDVVSGLSNGETCESNDDDSDSEVRRDLFDEVLRGAYLFDDDNNDEFLSNKSEYGVLLRWIYIFSAH